MGWMLSIVSCKCPPGFQSRLSRSAPREQRMPRSLRQRSLRFRTKPSRSVFSSSGRTTPHSERPRMKITIIGHLCLDVIRHPDGTETQSYGGIFFSVATLANLLGPKDSVKPVFGVGKGDYDAFIDRLKSYPNVDTSGVFVFNGPTNQVSLIYATDS